MGIFEGITLVLVIMAASLLLSKTVSDYRRYKASKSGAPIELSEEDLVAVVKLMIKHDISFTDAIIKYTEEK